MPDCGYEWRAPWLSPDGSKKHIPQVCVLPKGHVGKHQSWSKVTK